MCLAQKRERVAPLSELSNAEQMRNKGWGAEAGVQFECSEFEVPGRCLWRRC